MDIQALTPLFMWCTIINGGLLVVWTVALWVAPDFVYSVHKRWFPIPRETYDGHMYLFLGIFKILFVIFNFVPYVVLEILG